MVFEVTIVLKIVQIVIFYFVLDKNMASVSLPPRSLTYTGENFAAGPADYFAYRNNGIERREEDPRTWRVRFDKRGTGERKKKK